jgi:hypothetical protein
MNLQYNHRECRKPGVSAAASFALISSVSMLGMAATATKTLAMDSVCLDTKGNSNLQGFLDEPTGHFFKRSADGKYYVLQAGTFNDINNNIINNVGELKLALKNDPTHTLVNPDPNFTPMNASVSASEASAGGGSSGPPALASIETSNSQAEELIRQRSQSRPRLFKQHNRRQLLRSSHCRLSQRLFRHNRQIRALMLRGQLQKLRQRQLQSRHRPNLRRTLSLWGLPHRSQRQPNLRPVRHNRKVPTLR